MTSSMCRPPRGTDEMQEKKTAPDRAQTRGGLIAGRKWRRLEESAWYLGGRCLWNALLGYAGVPETTETKRGPSLFFARIGAGNQS